MGPWFAINDRASPGVEAAGDSILDKLEVLDRQTWWDWDWYKDNIPFFESPDGEIDMTYRASRASPS